VADNIETLPNGTVSTTFTGIGYAALRSSGCNISTPGGYRDYLIAGTYTIDEPICFNPLNGTTQRNLLLAPGAEIIVIGGGNLTITSSSVRGCSRMGRGITVKAGGILTLVGCSIRDCQFAVNAEPGSFVFVTGNTFTNNYVAVNANFSSSNFFFHVIEGNTFTSVGSLKPPFPGMVSAFGAVVNNIGAVGFAGINLNNVEGFFLNSTNAFTTLANGIVGRNSNLTINNQNFAGMVKDNTYGGLVGIGILATSTANNIKRLTVGAAGANTFTGCLSAAIFAQKMSGRITGNTVTASSSGFFWRESKNSKIQIDGNTLTVANVGISSYGNEPLLNALTVGSVGITTNTITATRGIRAEEGGGVADKGWLIDGNIINQTGKDPVGIYYARGVSGKVQSNIIGVAAANAIGIKLEYTKNAYCGVNNLDGTDNSVGTAILATGNRSPYLQCNNSNMINTGIQVMDLNEGGVVETNSFNNYKVGLEYTGSTMMPPMLHRGNCWDNANGGGLDASCESGIDVIFSKYFVDLPPSLGEMACYMPTNIEPTGWFKSLPTTPVTLTCSVLPPTIGLITGKDNWAIKVATHGWQPEKYTATTIGRAEFRLYQNLLNNPILVSQNAEFQIFKEEKSGTSIEKLAEIENIKQGLYALGSVEELQMKTLLDQRNQKADDFQMIKEGYTNNTATNTAILNNIFAELKAKNTALETFLNSRQQERAIQANNALYLNNSISVDALWIENHKTINGIYLTHVISQLDLSASEISTLQGIANQCPYEGGDAVYEARSILGFLDEAYNDVKLCNVESFRPNTLQRGQEIAIQQPKQALVYPSPVTDLLYINQEYQVDYQITIFNSIGKVVLEARNGQSPLSVSNFPSGLYRIAFQKAGKRTIYQNFSVVKL
jgi:Secretion system C-terminal sorting domain